jgi:hypothetical protein
VLYFLQYLRDVTLAVYPSFRRDQYPVVSVLLLWYLTTYTDVSYPLFLPSQEPRLSLEATQFPIQWLANVASTSEEMPGVKLTTHLCLVERLRICGTVTPLLHTSSWHSQELCRVSKNTQISNFMELRPVGAELFHATDWRTDMMKLIVVFSNFATALENFYSN